MENPAAMATVKALSRSSCGDTANAPPPTICSMRAAQSCGNERVESHSIEGLHQLIQRAGHMGVQSGQGIVCRGRAHFDQPPNMASHCSAERGMNT